MDKYTPDFTSEQVDEQVNWLLAPHAPAPQHAHNEQLVTDLSQMYQADARSLNRVRQRLGLEQTALAQFQASPAFQQPAGACMLDLDKGRSQRQPRKNRLARTFSLLAAACVAVLLIGGLLLAVRQAPRSQNAAPVQAQADLYTSDINTVYRLDPRTHQVLWQHAIPSLTKVIPAGQVVYLLQASRGLSVNSQNAVFALDARNGQLLWTHALKPQGGKLNVGFAIDMLLSEKRLYVSWNQINMTRNGAQPDSSDDLGQVVLLNTENGQQVTAYSAPGNVRQLASDGNVLAVATSEGLRVYSLASGKMLWSKVLEASTNVPVPSLTVSNGLLFASVMALDLQSNHTYSQIIAYNATTGVPAWRSPNFPADALAYISVDQRAVYLTTAEDIPNGNALVATHVYAYDYHSNKKLWDLSLDGGAFYPSALENGVLYIGTQQQARNELRVLAIQTTSGTIQWQKTLNGRYLGGIAAHNNAVYASSVTIMATTPVPDKLYALQDSTGAPLWTGTNCGSTIAFSA